MMSNLVSIMLNSINKGYTVVYFTYSEPHKIGAAGKGVCKGTAISKINASWIYSSVMLLVYQIRL